MVESGGEARAVRACSYGIMHSIYVRCVESDYYVEKNSDDEGNVECMAFRLLRVKDLDKRVCRRVNT